MSFRAGTRLAIDYVTSCGIFVFALIAMSEKAREIEEKDSCERAQETQAIAPGVFPAKGVGFDPMPSRRFPLVSWR